MESFQKCFNLRLDLLGHLGITNLLDIFQFLLFCYSYISAIWYKIRLLNFPKIVKFITPVKINHSFYFIFYDPFKIFVIFIILVLNIVKGYWLTKYVLIERTSEECIKHITIVESFSHNSANKFKEFYMVRIYPAVLVWLVSVSGWGELKETIVRIEYLFRE